MKRITILSVLLILIMAHAVPLSAQEQEEDGIDLDMRYRGLRKLLEEEAFETLKKRCEEDGFWWVFGDFIEKMQEKGKSHLELLPYYEFHKSNGTSENEFLEGLTEGKYLVAKEKGEADEARYCDAVVALVKEKRHDEALVLLRKTPEDHRACEMCALSFARILLHETREPEKAREKTELGLEMLRLFPQTINAQSAAAKLADSIGGSSAYRKEANRLHEELVKIVKQPALRMELLRDVATYHSFPTLSETTSLKKALDCYEELFKLASDKEWKQGYLMNIAWAKDAYARQVVDEGPWEKREEISREAYKGVAQAYLRAVEFAPEGTYVEGAISSMMTAFGREGMSDEAVELAFTWLKKAQADRGLSEPAAWMLFNATYTVPREDEKRRISILKQQIEKLPETASTAASCLSLGWIYYSRGDIENMLKYLEMGIRQVKTEHILTMTFSSSYRQECHRLLIKYYEEDKKDYAAALKLYREWKPQCGCGTCEAGMLEGREENILQLTQKLGLPLEESYLALVADGTLRCEGLVSLIRLLEEKEQIDRLRETARGAARKDPANEPATMALRYLGFREMADAQDIEILFETARKWSSGLTERGIGDSMYWPDHYDVGKFALMALATTGEKGLDFVLDKADCRWDILMEMEQGEELGEYGKEQALEGWFALHALGFFESEKAAEFLFKAYRAARTIVAGEEARKGEDIDAYVTKQVRDSYRMAGTPAAIHALKIMMGADEEDAGYARELFAGFASGHLKRALDEHFEGDIRKKLDLLYDIMVVEEGGEGAVLEYPGFPPGIADAFVSCGPEACNYLLERHKSEEQWYILALLARFDADQVKNSLGSLCGDDMSKKLEVLFDLCVLLHRERFMPSDMLEIDSLETAFLSFGEAAAEFAFRKVEESLVYPGGIVVMKLLRRMPAELTKPGWEKFLKSEDASLRALAEKELKELKGK